MTQRVTVDASLLTDLADMLSFLVMSIGSAKLSGASPTQFDLECLNVCLSVLNAELEPKSSTPSKRPGPDHPNGPNVVTFGATSHAKRTDRGRS